VSIEDFDPFKNCDDMLPGIPYVPNPPHVPEPPPPPLTPADYMYYVVTADIRVHLFGNFKQSEGRRFGFKCKRPKTRPFVMNGFNEAAIDHAVSTFLYQFGEEMNLKYGNMLWTTQIAACAVELLTDFSPSETEFDLLPETAEDARMKANPTFEEFKVLKGTAG
jgi:hypothetical protein